MRAFAAFILGLIGWRAVFTPPPGPKSVVIVYPHTSNWDFPLGMLFKAQHAASLRWAGKDTLFRWPLRWLFLRLGGVPINRREPTGIIGQLVEAFEAHERFSIVIAPEGTRAKSDFWKTGFYHLALAAKVPLGLGYIDYRTREVGIQRWMTLTGDEAADLNVIRAYYADKTARYPEQAGEIRFRRTRAP